MTSPDTLPPASTVASVACHRCGVAETRPCHELPDLLALFPHWAHDERGFRICPKCAEAQP